MGITGWSVQMAQGRPACQSLAGFSREALPISGFGGETTALAVNIETYPTHIAGLPVAVNVGCHVTRHAHRVL